MASWKWPAVLNKMLEDIPGINTLLNALLKQDPAGTTDVPAGAKRWTDTADGKQLQVWNGSSWSSVGKLDHDAASVDGYDASPTVLKNTIPVRDANGDLPGNITGNAATATKAAALSAVNPIEMGGTGGNTPGQARGNLGVPPTDHSSFGTIYGLGNSTEYGHNKLSDATNSDLRADGGTAATPLAVKTAKAEAITAAGEALEAFAEGQALVDAEQDAAIAEAKSSADEKVSALESLLRDLINDEIQKAVPAGTVIAFAANKAPDGFLLCNGAAVSRSTYAALFSAIGTTYGAGDGSSTFALPNLTDKFIQGSGTAGTVKAAGLPNITGTVGNWRNDVTNYQTYSGAFYSATATAGKGGYTGNDATKGVYYNFSAQKSNSIYGASTTVQPPALTMRYYIKY